MKPSIIFLCKITKGDDYKRYNASYHTQMKEKL
jgi:hypothetical protein